MSKKHIPALNHFSVGLVPQTIAVPVGQIGEKYTLSGLRIKFATIGLRYLVPSEAPKGMSTSKVDSG